MLASSDGSVDNNKSHRDFRFVAHKLKIGKITYNGAAPSARRPEEKKTHCLISNREGLGTSLLIMALATIDPHSHKVQTKLCKFPKFGVNQASLTEI